MKVTLCIFIALWEQKAGLANFFSSLPQTADNRSVCGQKAVPLGSGGGYFSGVVSFHCNLVLVLTGGAQLATCYDGVTKH